MFPMRCAQLPCRNIDVKSPAHVTPPNAQGAALVSPVGARPVSSAGIMPRVHTESVSALSESPPPCA